MQDDKIEKLWQDIKTQRDELRLQMHREVCQRC
jgi:hypothetical protein